MLTHIQIYQIINTTNIATNTIYRVYLFVIFIIKIIIRKSKTI